MKLAIASLGVLALLAGCATPPPSGPSVMVLPGSGKSFDQFRFDDNECRQFAFAQIGGTSNQQAANDAAARNAVVGTVVGAAAGGLIGGNQGAGVGAGVGLAGGALSGAGAGEYAGRTQQQRYDIGYQQCMYAKGHQIPMAARYQPYRQPSRQAAPPPPPPPPGGAPRDGTGCPSLLGAGAISGRKLPIERLVATLSPYVTRVIVDRTNLTGLYDLDLLWLPDFVPAIAGPGLPPPPVADATAPPLFTALQEQLGLKLDSSRGPVEVLVIDGVEKPSAD